MSNYHPPLQSTVSTLVIAGIFASTLSASSMTAFKAQDKDSFIQIQGYQSEMTKQTNGSRNIFSQTNDSIQFENFLTAFIEKLTSNQEKLEDDFQKILIDNLWDLYQA